MLPYEVAVTILLHRWQGICAPRGTAVGGRAGIRLDSQVHALYVPPTVTIPVGFVPQHSPSFQMLSRTHIFTDFTTSSIYFPVMSRQIPSLQSLGCLNIAILSLPLPQSCRGGSEDKHFGKRLPPLPKHIHSSTLNWCNQVASLGIKRKLICKSGSVSGGERAAC